MREDFEKVKFPHQYKGALLGVLGVPITVICKNGDIEMSQDWRRDSSLMHPLEHKYPWASDAVYEMYNQITSLRFAAPEVLHCFEQLGSRLFITEGDTSDYYRHVLNLTEVPERKPGEFTYGFALPLSLRGKTLLDVCVDSRGVFHDLNGRGAERTTFVHEIVHITDVEHRGETPCIGRFSNTDLMRAVLNTEINLNAFGVSADIHKRIQHYKPEKQLCEYLPRLFQQYLEDQMQRRNPERKKLSELETALIEKVFLPDCKLRANTEIAKAAILRSEYDRSIEEILFGVPVRNQKYMMKILTQNPPQKMQFDFHMNKAGKAIREELLAFIDEIPDHAMHYATRLQRRAMNEHFAEQNCDAGQAQSPD